VHDAVRHPRRHVRETRTIGVTGRDRNRCGGPVAARGFDAELVVCPRNRTHFDPGPHGCGERRRVAFEIGDDLWHRHVAVGIGSGATLGNPISSYEVTALTGTNTSRVVQLGAGESLACGSGAWAAVVAGIRLGLLDATVEVQTHGGVLTIAWAGGDTPVLMTGPATTVFHGEIDIPETL